MLIELNKKEIAKGLFAAIGVISVSVCIGILSASLIQVKLFEFMNRDQLAVARIEAKVAEQSRIRQAETDAMLKRTHESIEKIKEALSD